MAKSNRNVSQLDKDTNVHPINESKTAFGSEPVLSLGMTKKQYYALRDRWYNKAQKHGHVELERFNNHNASLVSSYLQKTTQQSASKSINYNVSDYYDYLSSFLHVLEYLKLNQPLRLRYSINRFFVYEHTHTVAGHKKTDKLTRKAPTRSTLKLNHNQHFTLNRYILQAIITGASLESISRYIGQTKPIKFQADMDRLSPLKLTPSILKQTKGLNKNRLWMRIRLIHECAFQYLALSGTVSAQDLYCMDLLGLDNPCVNSVISAQLGITVKPRSIATRYGLHIW